MRHLSTHVPARGEETRGRDGIAEALWSFRSIFDQLVYRPLKRRTQDDRAGLQVEYWYRHRPSGETLSGRLRLVFEVRDGKIDRAEEFYDRAKVEAFLRLYGC